MLVVFSLIFVADTKIFFGYNFVGPLKEHRCEFKIDKKTTQSRSLEQRMTIAKISLIHCILKELRIDKSS